MQLRPEVQTALYALSGDAHVMGVFTGSTEVASPQRTVGRPIPADHRNELEQNVIVDSVRPGRRRRRRLVVRLWPSAGQRFALPLRA